MAKTYQKLADEVARRISTGELPIGTVLRPQRRFAYEQGIAVSTASRVYEELRLRGLVSGEVGRGTFVTSRFTPINPLLQEYSETGIDLDIVFRLGSDAMEAIGQSTARFFKAGLTEVAAAPPSVRPKPAAASLLAQMMKSAGFACKPDMILLAGSGKEAIAAAFCTIAPRGGRIAVERLTYPFAVSVARLLGVDLVPLPVDEEGVVPDALEIEAKKGLAGVYLQPTNQSPLVLTMSDARRSAIAELLRRYRLPAVEDCVYGFLRPSTSLFSLAPDHVIRIDSLSKRLMPGLSLGLLSAPASYQDRLATALRSGGWMAPSFAVALAQHWIEEGVIGVVEATKRKEASAMYEIARRMLAGLEFRGAPDALHGWLALPRKWRSERFTMISAELGINVASGQSFAVVRGDAPAGVRIAFSAPNLKIWEYALGELASIAKRIPDPDGKF